MKEGNKQIIQHNSQINKRKTNVIDNLVDALFMDDFNQIISEYTNTELDFQTVVLFIKLYMMAFRVTQNEDINVRKQSIKELIHYVMKDSHTRSEIIRSFNDNTMIKTFFDQIKKKLA